MDAAFAAHLALYSALFFTALAAGAMVLFAAAVAPLVHKVLDKERARTLTRAIFPVYYLVLAIMAGLASIAGFLVNVAAGLVLAVIAAGFLFARQVMTPRINALNDEVARGSTIQAGPAKMLHAWSVRMNVLQLFVLLVVFWFFALSAG
jgi:flagellar biosynthesis protein FlhB